MTEKKSLLETLEYEPMPSRFGTSGVRALVEDLTDLEVYALVLGTLHYLKAIDKIDRRGRPADAIKIPLAGDLRPSTERILISASRAIEDAGYHIDYVGNIPTPALTYYALQRGVASFMVTGSHIPSDRNGIKANRSDGEVMKSDERGIIAAAQDVRQAQYARAAEASLFAADGMLKPAHCSALPAPDQSAERLYRERYRSVFRGSPLKNVRIVFFEYSAVGRELLPEILEQAGAQVIRVGRSDEFVPIDTEAISDHHLHMFRDLIAEQRKRYGPINALVSTDGDSDRPLVIAVDEQPTTHAIALRFVPGDLLGSVVADFLKSDAVAVPISVNPAVHEYFAARGLVTRKTRIGSPYVIEAMQAALRDGFQRISAWEANGGFLLGSALVLNGAELNALPTRDAMLPLLCVLCAAAEQGVPPHKLLESFPEWFGKSGLIDDFSRGVSQRILDYFMPHDERIKWQEFGKDRVVLRDFEERLITEWGCDDARARQAIHKKQQLEAVFHSDLGFSRIVRLNTLDGIRCYFDNGEIAHIRPSGNAPQLRIYAYARYQGRADEIVMMAVAEPDGILRNLERFIARQAG